MTKWNIPEGRKPLTDADMAALTRRLADTSIEQSELYQAAKRDAEEAEAYAAELEAQLQDMALDCLAAQGQAAEAYQAQLAAEGRLDAALERGFWAGRSCGGSKADIDAALAELKGGQ